jgi:hypothetical protein
MLDQLINLVKEYGRETVVENNEVPNQYNEQIMADATSTIGSGFQNILAGGGLSNILDLFRGGGNNSNTKSSGIGGLLKNPIVTMMIGYFINKLVSKYKMNPQSASNVSNNLIPNVLNGLIQKTTSHAPENDAFDFNDLIGSLTGGKVPTSESSSGGFNFQGLLDKFVGGGNGDASMIDNAANQVKEGILREEEGQKERGGLLDMIQGFFSSKS